MKRSMIAPVSTGAIALTVGGYAVGSTRPGDPSGLAAGCEPAKQEFRTRTAQIRKQILAPLHEREDGLRQYTMIVTRVKMVSAIIGPASPLLRSRDSRDSGGSAARPVRGRS
jgi:hypothetical protein